MLLTTVTIVLYLIRMISAGIAVGTLFIKLGLFHKMGNEKSMVVGVASTPMFISLMDYLLGLVVIGWSCWFYYMVPFAISIVWIFCFSNHRIALAAIKDIGGFAKGIIRKAGKWVLLDWILSLGLVFIAVLIFYNTDFGANYVKHFLHSLNFIGILVTAIFVVAFISAILYIVRQMHTDGSLRTNCYLFLFIVTVECGIFFGMSLNGRPDIDSDRAHYQLDARYFMEDKNSWEVDHYSDEKYGSSLSDDHGPLWIMYLADGQMLADMVGLDNPLRICNFAIFWTYCCFNILMFLSASFISKTYAAGILSLLLFGLYKYDALMILGSRDAFRFVGLLLLFLYVSNVISDIMEEHIKWQHYAFVFIFCYISMNGHEGNVYIMLGMFIVVAILLIVNKTRIRNLILCGVSVLGGTVLGGVKTIVVYLETGRISSSTILPFHDTPVVQQIIDLNNDRADWAAIWGTYTKPVLFMMGLGVLALIMIIVISVIQKDKGLFFSGMIILGMLLPMTGIMDWIGYECSRWFAEQLRYRMYFLMLFAITGGWLLTRAWMLKSARYACTLVTAIVFLLYLSVGNDRLSIYSRQYVSDCNATVERYKDLADTVASITDGDVFTNNQVILYYLHGTPKLLYHVYAEDLIQAKTDEEIEAAMEKLNVGAILLPESGLDYHDYSLLPFWNFINEDESFDQIASDVDGYVIYYRKDNIR